jgi:hypothetical protein
MTKRLGSRMMDAMNTIEMCINKAKLLRVSNYLEGSHIMYQIDDYTTSDQSGNEIEYANFDLILYVREVLREDNDIDQTTLTLRVFCAEGLYQNWTPTLRYKVWESEFPSTVAISKEEQTVYFLCVQSNDVLELKKFSKLKGNQYNLIMTSVLENIPFHIEIAHNALYSFVDESEGLNFLRKNIGVTFNCNPNFTVYSEDYYCV